MDFLLHIFFNGQLKILMKLIIIFLKKQVPSSLCNSTASLFQNTSVSKTCYFHETSLQVSVFHSSISNIFSDTVPRSSWESVWRHTWRREIGREVPFHWSVWFWKEALSLSKWFMITWQREDSESLKASESWVSGSPESQWLCVMEVVGQLIFSLSLIKLFQIMGKYLRFG